MWSDNDADQRQDRGMWGRKTDGQMHPVIGVKVSRVCEVRDEMCEVFVGGGTSQRRLEC